MELRSRKISILSHGIIGLILAILLVVASFYDLQISHYLSNSESFFGILFLSLSEVPAYILLPISGCILYFGINGTYKQRILYRVLAVIIIFLGFLVWGLMGSRQFQPKYLAGLSLVYSAILSMITIWLGRLIGAERLSKYTKWAVFAIVVVVVSLIVTRLMKLAWGRMRYRDMLDITDFAGFTPWYLPQGIRGGDMTSFPSGHTAHACNIFVFCMLIDYSEKYRKYRVLTYAAGLLFVVLTGLSRIIYNAHFLSDVIVGGAVSYACYYLMKYLIFRRHNSLAIKNIEDSPHAGGDNITIE